MLVVCVRCGDSVKAGRGMTIHLKKCKTKIPSTISLTTVRDLGPVPRVNEQGDVVQPTQNEDFYEDSSIQDFTMEIDELAPAQPALLEAPLELPSGSKRTKRLPARFKDHVPSSSRPSVLPTESLPHFLDHVPPQPIAPSPPVPVSSPELDPAAEPQPAPRKSYTSPSNDYGLFRVYPDFPDDEPDACLELEDLCDSPNLSTSKGAPEPPSMPSFIKNPYAPFKNFTSFLITKWANRPVNKKTFEEMDELVRGVLLHPLFRIEDLRDYTTKSANELLDRHIGTQAFIRNNEENETDCWREGHVKLKLPAEDGKKHPEGENGAPEVEIEGIYYRPITETIYNALDNPNAAPFHFSPYQEYWKSERVYGELYSADAWLEAHEEVRSLPREDEVENFVLPILLYSDSTHLANFGTASLWPLYMHLGSQSKYIRGKTTESTCHHLAYIPSLPASIQDVYKDHYGRGASAGLFTYLRRELMQRVLSQVLFQSDFLELYTNGVRFRCSDNVIRRLFPRVMAYSADYPERMLVATLKVMSANPCPKCFIAKDQIHMLGTARDKQIRSRSRNDDQQRQDKITNARKWIFEAGYTVSSGKVKDILGSGSLVPVHNAFSVLSPYGLNFYEMFAPDIMHEFELGVWGKTILPHLMRVLDAQGGDVISTLNARYRAIPTFCDNTIRLFPVNTAAMSKLAARDYEDLLQCAIPAFEDLLDDERHNKLISQILFTLATWHSLAKLRIHTETTLRALEAATMELGREARLLKVETSIYNTRELEREVAARGRRQIAMVKKGGETRQGSKQGETLQNTPRRKELNIDTPKFHSLGEYVHAIRRLGTTDNYSTQIGESQHKRVKKMYGRTNKRNAAKDVSKLEGRSRALELIETRISIREPSARSTISIQRVSPDVHYHMPASEKDSTNLGFWLYQNKNDPAIQNFRDDLRSHILGRILDRAEYEGFTPKERSGLHIRHDKLYWHKVIRINYTTYDLRRKQDSCNPRSHPDVMLLASEDGALHPYTYARIVRLFHLKAAYNGPGRDRQDYQRMDIVWVRWFQYDSNRPFSFKKKHLPQIRFMHYTEPDSFGFIDPDTIVRAVHLIPRFSKGYTTSYLPDSLVRVKSFKDQDFRFYFVNIFVDRDIFMRYRGGGIGHKSTWHLHERLMEDIPTDSDSSGEIIEDAMEILGAAVEEPREEESDEITDRDDDDELESAEGDASDEDEDAGDEEYAEL